MRTFPLICLLFFCFLIAPCSSSFAERSPFKGDYPSLCPQGKHSESVNMKGQTISMPKLIEEKEFLKRLNSGDEKQAVNAAISLGLGGNLEAFSFLLEKRDINL